MIDSQFESEAETHILAALEMKDQNAENDGTNYQSRLLGEGIDSAMEDYSDDDEVDGKDASESGGNRSRTWSTDSFLRKVQLASDLPQYRVGDSETGSSPGSTPRRKKQNANHPRKDSFDRSVSGDNPSLLYSNASSAQTGKSLSMHIQNDSLEVGDDPFLQAARQQSSEGPKTSNTVTETSNGLPTITEETIDTIHDATEATNGMTFMAKQLRNLQKRRPSMVSNDGSSVHSGLNNGGESSGDRLIDALNRVDSSKNKSFCAKLQSEYRDLIVPKLPEIYRNIAQSQLFVVFPLLMISAVLFYQFDNPMAGTTGTSISWWLNFVVRQVVMFEIARAGEVFWIEILALRSKLFTKGVGPYVSLTLIQSQGW